MLVMSAKVRFFFRKSASFNGKFQKKLLCFVNGLFYRSFYALPHKILHTYSIVLMEYLWRIYGLIMEYQEKINFGGCSFLLLYFPWSCIVFLL